MHQKCSSCQAADATVQILDLENSAIVKSKFLCDACAGASANAGSAATTKMQMQLSAEILESLLGGQDAATAAEDLDPAAQTASCPACNLTAAEFRLRGRLGCPRCYEIFRQPLLTVLDRVHDATCHRGRFPGRPAPDAPPPQAPEPRVNVTEIERRLTTAVEEERYEDAARLRDELDRARRMHEEGS